MTLLHVSLLVLPVALVQLSDDPEELLNWCLDGVNHKSKPGPEDELYNQCTPWKQRSCCTHNTTRVAHHTNMYNFDYSHCSQVKNISHECRKHFIQDLCFYECSPNTGPWIVKVNMKIRKERFFQVPLCQSDCNAWFDACVDDYTCVDNWVKGFQWSKLGNRCPPGAECRTVKEVFGTAENFCEKIWDHSWKYTADDQPCMRIWFDGTKGNPNDNVAKLKVQQLMRNTSGEKVSLTITCLILTTIIIFTLLQL